MDETAFAEGVSGSVPNKGVDGHSSFSGVDANTASIRFSQIGKVPKPQSHLGTKRGKGKDKERKRGVARKKKGGGGRRGERM